MSKSVNNPIVRGSEFFATSNQGKCEGDFQCHYCLAPCKMLWLHKEPAPLPFVRKPTTAKKPDSPWMCWACWTWGFKRVTVYPVSGGFKDNQCFLNHSTFITESKSFVVILPKCKEALYDLLLTPPLKFSLALLEGEHPPQNLLQLHVVNSNTEVKADTELHFTINGIPHTYTVHELEECIINGDNGRIPGARALYRVLGDYPKVKPGDMTKEKLRRGRPTTEEQRVKDVDPREGKHDRVVTEKKAS